ncbi:MAG: DUF6273 domain-containing protein [Lachnospiraceae bacterium]
MRKRWMCIGISLLFSVGMLMGCGEETVSTETDTAEAVVSEDDIRVEDISDETADEEEIVEEVCDYEFQIDGEYVIFGSYEQDNNLDNGPEPIEWIVLAEHDGKALLLSRYILDGGIYTENGEADVVSWENSDIRTWLNNDFYNEAFSEEEKTAMLLGYTEYNYYDADSEHDTVQGESQDYVFLLSNLDAWTLWNVFDENSLLLEGVGDVYITEYFFTQPTEYAKANDVIYVTQENLDRVINEGLGIFQYSNDLVGMGGYYFRDCYSYYRDSQRVAAFDFLDPYGAIRHEPADTMMMNDGKFVSYFNSNGEWIEFTNDYLGIRPAIIVNTNNTSFPQGVTGDDINEELLINKYVPSELMLLGKDEELINFVEDNCMENDLTAILWHSYSEEKEIIHDGDCVAIQEGDVLIIIKDGNYKISGCSGGLPTHIGGDNDKTDYLSGWDNPNYSSSTYLLDNFHEGQSILFQMPTTITLYADEECNNVISSISFTFTIEE